MSRLFSTGWLRQTRRFVGVSLLMIALFNPTSVYAQEVKLKYQGITLNANLKLADDQSLADGVILMTHGSLAHYGMELITYLQNGLKDKHLNTLAINLSLALDDRHGMYDCNTPHRHRNEDAVDEIGVWLDWLKQQGAKKVTLFGHSRGGAQTALFAAQHHDPIVTAVVLLAPATRDNGADTFDQRYGKPIKPLLARAEALVKENHGDTILEHAALMTCRDAPVSATSFVSYYTHIELQDTPILIPKITSPVLVIVATDDEIVVNLAPKIEPLTHDHRVQLKVIENSDHFFRDLNADEVIDAMDQFIEGLR